MNNKFFPYYPVLVGFLVIAVIALGQSLPTVNTNIAAKIKARGGTNFVAAPPPQFLRVTASPISAHVWRSQDLRSWLDSGTNALTVANNGGAEFYHGSYNPRCLVTWTGSSNAIAFALIQTSQAFPPGAFLTIPLPPTNAATVPVFAGSNNFWLCEIDSPGCPIISQFAGPASVVATNPAISITPTNSP